VELPGRLRRPHRDHRGAPHHCAMTSACFWQNTQGTPSKLLCHLKSELFFFSGYLDSGIKLSATTTLNVLNKFISSTIWWL
jgi:hypothetical protein